MMGFPEEEGRGVRAGEEEVPVRLGGGRGARIVSPSTPVSLSTSVTPASESRAWPHEEQNRAFAETFAPHVEQNMGGEILPPVSQSTLVNDRTR